MLVYLELVVHLFVLYKDKLREYGGVLHPRLVLNRKQIISATANLTNLQFAPLVSSSVKSPWHYVKDCFLHYQFPDTCAFAGYSVFPLKLLFNADEPNYFFQPIGDLGTLNADEKGEAFYSGVKEKLRVANLIGRSIAVYETEDRSDKGITAAVIARSAGVGENYKKLCTCDGTTIWESSNNDFVTSKV